MKRRSWIEPNEAIPVVRQCELASVSRSTVYARRWPAAVDETDLLQCRLIDEEYTRRSFYGSRRMAIFLKREGHEFNRKRVQWLMRLMGLAGITRPPYQPASFAAQALSPSAAGHHRHTSQSGLEHRYHLYPPGTGFCLSGGDHRLVQPQSAEPTVEQYDGCGLLYRLPRRGSTRPWHTRGL